MYQSHWGLSKSPFRGCLDPDFFHQSPTHEEALARLHFLVEHGRRLGLLMGQPGSGKSLLLEVFSRQLNRRGSKVARVNLSGVGAAEMLSLLAADFQLSPDPAAPVSVLWRLLSDRLSEFRFEQTHSVILLDDAERADPAVLTQVTRLVQHDPTPQSRLTIVMAARREQIGCLGERLLELAELRIDVQSWEESDTKDFLQNSLQQAGGKSSVFADTAVARLHELADGIPRRVAQLADLSLLAGAGRQITQIDADVVDSAYNELGAIRV